VVVTSRVGQSAQGVADEFTAEGLAALGLELDQGDEKSIETFTEAVADQCGTVDILVNNAVHRQGRGLLDTTAVDWDATSQVNSRGLFLLTQALVQPMVARGQGGSVINIGSIYGIVGPTFEVYDETPMTSPAFYSYDKAGMIGFTRYLAAALGPAGVRVNCLCPGGLRSEGQPEAFVREYVARTPLRRMASVDDVTGPLVFLASEAAAYVTGTVLPVDGGWTVH
jgi:NAD(P)-dependent dehydrogenase (short-subunit alcohol dehydrogenase family)